MVTGIEGVEGVEGMVGVHTVPPAARALSAVSDPDYADRFTLVTDAVGTAEEWARAILGDVPNAAELLVWRVLLRLRLSRERSPATVAGWRIADRGPGWIRLEATSWFLTCALVVEAGGGRVSLGTFLRYDRPPGRVLWPPVSAVHRRVVPRMLRDAAVRIGAAGAGRRPAAG